jgi:RNA polymerase primary sigma factor
MKQLRITSKITCRDSESIKYYLSEIAKIDLISEQEEEELSKKIKQGDEVALEKLVSANLRFVISVAKQYQNRGLQLSDLINEGNVGLIKAAQRFDETRGFKFISYAVWWIRQSILQALAEHSRIVRIPTNQISTANKVGRVFSELSQEFEIEPTPEEISKILNEKEGKIYDLISINKRSISMDTPIDGEGEERTYHDVIPDKDNNKMEKIFNDESFLKDIESVINKLKFREKRVLCMYYGIMGYQAMTLEEIGDYFDLTRERVRQIKDNAIRSLRLWDKSKILKEYLD